MNAHLFGVLLGLRYRLLWAKVRTRGGRMALFFVAYLLAMLLVVLLSLGGVAAGVAAAKMGRAELVARIVLGSGFVNAIFIAVVLGFGLNEAFSDSALRPYPVSAVERLIVRHLTALLDPFWLFVLALDLGLAVGLSVLGAATLWVAVPVVVVLIITNYLFARTLSGMLTWLLATRAGPFIAVAGISVLASTPAFVVPWIKKSPGVGAALVALVNLTPPSAAGSIMTGTNPWGWIPMGLWLVALVVAVAWLERHPVQAYSVGHARAEWDSPWDRIAAAAGPTLGPLVGKMLRYYVRNPQLRYNYPFMLPMLAMFVFMGTDHGDVSARFPAALGAAGFLAMSSGAMSLNAFGFDGAGFRRYFLLPISPTAVVRAAALVSLLPGLSLLPFGLLLWLLFSHVPSDARMMTMLVSSGLGGIFLIQALGLWTSILAPRAMRLTVVFGNRLSLPANLVLGVGIFGMMLLPHALVSLTGNHLADLWWTMPLFVVAAAGFFVFSVEAAGNVFGRRREEMLRVIERGN